MRLPKFTPLAPVVQDQGKFGRRIDHEATPRCRLCPEDGPVDTESGLGLECWRIFVALPFVLAAGHELPENKP